MHTTLRDRAVIASNNGNDKGPASRSNARRSRRGAGGPRLAQQGQDLHVDEGTAGRELAERLGAVQVPAMGGSLSGARRPRRSPVLPLLAGPMNLTARSHRRGLVRWPLLCGLAWRGTKSAASSCGRRDYAAVRNPTRCSNGSAPSRSTRSLCWLAPMSTSSTPVGVFVSHFATYSS